MKYVKYVIAGIGLGFICSGCICAAMVDDDGAIGIMLIQVGQIIAVLFSVIIYAGSPKQKHSK